MLLITTILQVIAVCIIVALYNIYLAIIFLIYFLLYIGIRNYTDRESSIYLRKQKHEVDRYSSLFSQILSGLQEIKTFVKKYFPESIPDIIGKYTNGNLYTILVWVYVIIMSVFLYYVINIFIKKRKI